MILWLRNESRDGVRAIGNGHCMYPDKNVGEATNLSRTTKDTYIDHPAPSCAGSQATLNLANA